MLQFYANKPICYFYTDLRLPHRFVSQFEFRRCIDEKRYIINLCDFRKVFAAFQHRVGQATDLTSYYDYIPYFECNATSLQISDDEFNTFQPFSPICMNISSITIFSDYFGSSSKSCEIDIIKCVGSSLCGTPTEIDDYLNGLFVYFVTLNSYYDENDTSYFKLNKIFI